MTDVLMMVSSGPRYRMNRDRWRKDVEGLAGVKLVFLVAKPPDEDTQQRVGAENGVHGDIVQSSVTDGHRKLGYKILSGYVWSFLHCSKVGYVAKSDDNVELDMVKMMEALQSRKDITEDFIGCSTPNRNSKTLRSARPHMSGNWSISKQQFELDTMPDFCTGFLYVTTPRVGAQLVQVGHKLYRETEVEQIEDSLITGVLRERLEGVVLDTLETGVMAKPWLHIFSHCPWMIGFKITFFNDMVISKRSSRSDVQYVGGLTEPGVWRYFLCLQLEGGLSLVEDAAPGLVPQVIWDVCHR